MGQVFVFTSGKGGVGKTTIAANLAYCLANHNYKVILADFDFGLRNLDILMGIEHKIIYHLGDVLKGTCSLKHAVIKDYRNENLHFLPGMPGGSEFICEEGLTNILEVLKDSYDYVILDGPAGIEYGFRLSISYADTAFLVVNPEMCSLRDANRIRNYILSHQTCAIHLIVNRKRTILFHRNYLSVSDIEEMLHMKAYGVIPNDATIMSFTNQGEFLYPGNVSVGLAIHNICNKIIAKKGSTVLC